MELLKKLKTTPIPKLEPDASSIKFIEDSNLVNIVNKGLAELYRIQPKNPITFLSNYLLNESYSKKLLSKIDNDLKIKEETIQKVKKNEEIIAEEAKKVEEKQKIKGDKIQKLKDLITNSVDFSEDFNEICEELKDIIGATGVYITSYELKRRKVESIDEDENAHIDPENIKVLRYIHWNKDHDFLKNKYIEPKTGVTYSLFLQGGEDEENEGEGEGDNAGANKDEENEGEGEGNNENTETNANNNAENTLKNVLINDVLSNNKIIFYREPRLGAYFALNLAYNSSMNANSLNSAITNKEQYNAKMERRKQLLEEKGENKEEGNENSNEDEEEEDEEEEKNEGNNNEEKEEEDDLKKPIKLQDYEREEKILVLSVDTLGQDRTFTDGEKELINEIGVLIKNSLENLEKKLLEKDRDLRMDYNVKEKQLVEDWPDDKIYTDKENFAKDYLNSEEAGKYITDECEKPLEEEYAKAASIISNIYNTEFINNLQLFDKFEFVQYENIFQNIFYFCKVEPVEINEPETNKLQWKIAKNKWGGIFDMLKEYNPFGAKPDKIKSIFKGNKILENLSPYLEEEKMEELSKYSFSLIRVIDFIVSILKVRKNDIIVRHTTQRQKIKERNEIIKQNEKIDKERKRDLEKAKAEYYGQKYNENTNEEEEKEENEENEEGGEEQGNEEGNEKKEESDKSSLSESVTEKDDDDEGDEEGNNGEENVNSQGNAVEHKKEEEKEEVVPFNEKEWLELYDQEHQKNIVPDEVKVDLDGDFDIEEDEGEEGTGGNEEGEDGDDGDDKE